MTATTTPPPPPETQAQDQIDCTRERTLASARRCIGLLLNSIGREYQRCGKAACARSRRCRGFACEPHTGGET